MFEGKSAEEIIAEIDAREALKEKYKKQEETTVAEAKEPEVFDDPITPVTTVDNKESSNEE